MFEVLNMTSKHFNLGILEKIPNMVEMQPKTHKKMIGMMRMSESSFNVAPISVLKDVISSYDPDTVILDDTTNVPGAIEVITTDLKKSVLLASDMNREIIRFPAVV